ncbi:DNA alkylation repair protein [Pseudomonadota bacterium]
MEPFKNKISPQLVQCIGAHLQKSLSGFRRSTFEGPVLARLESLELKERMQLIADHLHLALPNDLRTRAQVLRAMLHPTPSLETSDKHGIGSWGVVPMTLVVGQHGLDDFDGSLDLLKDMTEHFSSEFAVRYFLLADQERVLGVMGGWINDANPHVRRLVSEGTRPRLPWAMQLPALIEEPSPMIGVLTRLRDDESEYVRRSVANHLNDISKDHPDMVAKLASDWMLGANEERKRLIRHGLRTLVKQGHAAALKALGHAPPRLDLEDLRIETPKVALGEKLVFTARLSSRAKKPQPLIVDYLVHFKKANGKRVPKVFKWKKITLQGGESITLERAHAIRAITTRKYYTGRHALSLRINGQDFGLVEFDFLG